MRKYDELIRKIELDKTDLYCIENYNKYGMDCTKNDFITLLVNLVASGENLESAHDNILGYNNYVCQFVTNFETMQELLETVLEYTQTWDSYEDFVNYMHQVFVEDGESCYEITDFNEFMEFYNNGDCDILEYNGKIYKRVYC